MISHSTSVNFYFSRSYEIQSVTCQKNYKCTLKYKIWRGFYWAPFSSNKLWKAKDNPEIYFTRFAELVQQEWILIDKFMYVYLYVHSVDNHKGSQNSQAIPVRRSRNAVFHQRKATGGNFAWIWLNWTTMIKVVPVRPWKVNIAGSSKLMASLLWGIFLFKFFCIVQNKLIHKGKYEKRMYFSEQINVNLLHVINFLTSRLKQVADSQHCPA